MGGITNTFHHLERVDGPVAGLYDAGEERFVLRSLQRRGADVADRAGLQGLGFFCCEVDLEDELIRALGGAAVIEVIDAEGELGLLHTFQQQPFQRSRSLEQQLHRFCGTKSGRKVRLAAALAESLPIDGVPAPLLGVLRFTQRR